MNLQIDRLNLPISYYIPNTLGHDDAAIHLSISLAHNLKLFLKKAQSIRSRNDFCIWHQKKQVSRICMGRNELWRTRRRESRAEKMNKHDVNEPLQLKP